MSEPVAWLVRCHECPWQFQAGEIRAVFALRQHIHQTRHTVSLHAIWSR